MKLAVVQRFLPHYRVDFFSTLHKLVAAGGGSMRLFFSHTIGRLDSQPRWAQRLIGLRADMRLGELDESAIFAPTLGWHLNGYAPDVVILEDLAGLPNSLVGAAYCRMRGIPYLVWGLGNVPGKARSRLRRALAPVIRFLYDGAAGFICYSTYAAEVYAQYGKPTYVAPNSFLPRPSASDVVARVSRVEERARAAQIHVISIGTLKRQKRTDVLLEALAISDATLVLHVVGDGPDRQRLEARARALGLAGRVHFHGALYDGPQKVALFAHAHIGVLPGRGGLSIQELLAHGIPVISGVADGTERDMIGDGVHGYLIDGFPTASELADRLRRFSLLSPAQRIAMGNAALKIVLDQSNIENMAAAMAGAAERTATGTARGRTQL